MDRESLIKVLDGFNEMKGLAYEEISFHSLELAHFILERLPCDWEGEAEMVWVDNGTILENLPGKKIKVFVVEVDQ